MFKKIGFLFIFDSIWIILPKPNSTFLFIASFIFMILTNAAIFISIFEED
jgi:hypothetical protein